MKCLIYNVNDFCGEKMTLKNGGVEIDGIVNSILEYIGKEGFQLVALQEFPINHKSGKKLLMK